MGQQYSRGGARYRQTCGTEAKGVGLYFAWMDGQAFNEWLCQVMQLYVAARDNNVLVLLDNFSVHMQHGNVSALQILCAEVEVIPAGYTTVLQAMDKGLHKPFKQYQFKPLFGRHACYMHAAENMHTMSLIGQHR